MKAKSTLEIATAVLEKIKKEVKSSADTIDVIEFETVCRKMTFSIQNLISFIAELLASQETGSNRVLSPFSA